jgi:chain length determinant protein tyrosine kinase EpsG
MNNPNPQDIQSIGDIIREANKLSPEQLEEIVRFQKSYGVRFGEAAVALKFIKHEDVLWALSKQFHYSYFDALPDQVSKELVIATNPFDAAAESFREIRSKLITELFSVELPRRALAITSPSRGDGKSYFAANLAIAFSQLGARTVLVDADMRNPRLHDMLRCTARAGLSGFLSGRASATVVRPIAQLENLYFMPVGVVPPNPQELLQNRAFGHCINELINKFEYVIIDTPAASVGADARVIAKVAGASLVVARKQSTPLNALRELVTALGKSDHKMLGVVMNESLQE